MKCQVINRIHEIYLTKFQSEAVSVKQMHLQQMSTANPVSKALLHAVPLLWLLLLLRRQLLLLQLPNCRAVFCWASAIKEAYASIWSSSGSLSAGAELECCTALWSVLSSTQHQWHRQIIDTNKLTAVCICDSRNSKQNIAHQFQHFTIKWVLRSAMYMKLQRCWRSQSAMI